MGYAYSRTGGLCCDQCGCADGTVRKRTCPFTVVSDYGHVMAYCPAPAVCSKCLTELGGTRAMHESFGCPEGARISQERYDATKARTEAGDHKVRSASGSWAPWVPIGMVGVITYGDGGEGELRWLVDNDEYEARSSDPFIEDFPTRYQFRESEEPCLTATT